MYTFDKTCVIVIIDAFVGNLNCYWEVKFTQNSKTKKREETNCRFAYVLSKTKFQKGLCVHFDVIMAWDLFSFINKSVITNLETLI